MWYAIKTEPEQEEKIQQKLRNLVREGFCIDWRVLYCVRKKRYLGQWHAERERFLPGYLFLVMDEKQIPDVFEAFEYSPWLVPVRREEEQFLMSLTGGREIVEMSYGVIANGVLQIREGALAGMESRVKKIDRHKRKGYVSMRISDEERMAEIGLEITEKT